MEFSPSLSIAAMGGWSDGNVQRLPSGLATGTSKEPNFPIKTVSTQLSNNSCALRRNVRNMSFSFGASGGDSGSSSGMYSIAFAMLSRPSSAACFSDSSMLWSRDFNLLKFWPLKHQATIHCTWSRMHQNAKLHRLWQKGKQQTLYHLSYIMDKQLMLLCGEVWAGRHMHVQTTRGKTASYWWWSRHAPQLDWVQRPSDQAAGGEPPKCSSSTPSQTLAPLNRHFSPKGAWRTSLHWVPRLKTSPNSSQLTAKNPSRRWSAG